jgi:hypothetical protein
MKITFTIDSALRDKLDGSNRARFWDTYSLIRGAADRGHDVSIVHSEDAIKGGGFSKEFFLESGFEKSGEFTLPDTLFIRGYGMRVGKDCFDKLVDGVRGVEKKIPIVINSANATAFSRKDRQKKLPLPYIPYHRISSLSEVSNLLNEHKDGLILKPDYGLQSAGVEYLASIGDLESLLASGSVSEEALIKDYSFEKFIPNKKETRYIFLFGEMVGSRIADKEGLPARETLGRRYLNKNPDTKQLRIARKAIELTGIDFGCVDFRGNNILEINGSGTQTFYRHDVGGSKIFLDLTKKILDTIESRYKNL